MDSNNQNLHNHPPFQYFHNPHGSSDYSNEKQKCNICGNNKPGYKGGVVYGINDVCQELKFICEDCIVAGKLRKNGCSNNEGNLKVLLAKLQEKNSEPKDEIKQIAEKRTNEIECCTPHVSSWQGFTWLVHCADYCCFIGEMGKKELNALSIEENGREFLDLVIFNPEEDKYELDEIWESLPDNLPQKRWGENNFLLFQCLHCGRYLRIIDSE